MTQDLDKARNLTQIIYFLYIASVIAGITAIIAIIINYLKRDEVAGTWLESHFRWQIRTFWFAVMWIAVSLLMVITVIGVPFAIAVLLLAGLWILYRIVRGWWVLIQRRPLPMP